MYPCFDTINFLVNFDECTHVYIHTHTIVYLYFNIFNPTNYGFFYLKSHLYKQLKFLIFNLKNIVTYIEINYHINFRDLDQKLKTNKVSIKEYSWPMTASKVSHMIIWSSNTQSSLN